MTGECAGPVLASACGRGLGGKRCRGGGQLGMAIIDEAVDEAIDVAC